MRDKIEELIRAFAGPDNRALRAMIRKVIDEDRDQLHPHGWLLPVADRVAILSGRVGLTAQGQAKLDAIVAALREKS